MVVKIKVVRTLQNRLLEFAWKFQSSFVDPVRNTGISLDTAPVVPPFLWRFGESQIFHVEESLHLCCKFVNISSSPVSYRSILSHFLQKVWDDPCLMPDLISQTMCQCLHWINHLATRQLLHINYTLEFVPTLPADVLHLHHATYHRLY